MSSIALPEQTLYAIFQHLAATDHPALSHVSLASRQFRRIAIPLVLNQVTVSGELLCEPSPILDYARSIKKITFRNMSTAAYSSVPVRERATNFGGLLRRCVNLEVLELGEDGKKFVAQDSLIRLALENAGSLPNLRTFIDYSQRDIFERLPSLVTVTSLFLFGPSYSHLEYDPRTTVLPRRTFPNLQHLFLRNFGNSADYPDYFPALQTSQMSYGKLESIFTSFHDLNRPTLPPQTGVVKIGGGVTVDFSVQYDHQCRTLRCPSLHLVLFVSNPLTNDDSGAEKNPSTATKDSIDHAQRLISEFESLSVKCSFIFERTLYCGRVEELKFVLKTKAEVWNSLMETDLLELEAEKSKEMVAAKKMREMDRTQLVESIEKVNRTLRSGSIDGIDPVAVSEDLILEREWE